METMRMKTVSVRRATWLFTVAAFAVMPWLIGTAHSTDTFPALGFATITTGPSAGDYPAEWFPWSQVLGVSVDGRGNGPTVFGGNGCDRSTVPSRDDYDLGLDYGEEAIIVFSGDGCSSSYKVESGQEAGYDLVLVATTHEGSGQGADPDALACPPKDHQFPARVPAVCIGHRAMHNLFNTEAGYSGPDADVTVGREGERIDAVMDSDGDGLLDPVDNCKLNANADQDDSDQDGLGNVCDPTDGTEQRALGFAITTGPSAGDYPAEWFPWSQLLGVSVDGRGNGPTVFGGNGCDRSTVPSRDDYDLGLDYGEEAIIVFSGDGCSSSYKVESGQEAGYDLVLVATTHEGSGQGADPDALACPPKDHQFPARVPAVCIGHRAMHNLFNTEAGYSGPDADVTVGREGERIDAVMDSDGDGSLDPVDNCKLNANADQDDSDQDGLGNVCDPWNIISYEFTGFFAPVESPPAVNVVKAGAALPLRFSLGGFHGTDIFAPKSPRSMNIGCDFSGDISDVKVIGTSGASSLSYDSDSGQYHLVWKTDKAWANSCRQLDIALQDGSHHRANFRFTG
jgi:hypothetical protein